MADAYDRFTDQKLVIRSTLVAGEAGAAMTAVFTSQFDGVVYVDAGTGRNVQIA